MWLRPVFCHFPVYVWNSVIWTHLPETRQQCTSLMDWPLKWASDFFLFSHVWQKLNRNFQQINLPVFIICYRQAMIRVAIWAMSEIPVCCNEKGQRPISHFWSTHPPTRLQSTPHPSWRIPWRRHSSLQRQPVAINNSSSTIKRIKTASSHLQLLL